MRLTAVVPGRLTVRCRGGCLHWLTMRKHQPTVVARAVPRVSGTPVRPGSAAAGSTWLLLGLVLAGLVAMHGLGTHGTHAVHATEAMTAAMTAPSVAGVAGAGDSGMADSSSHAEEGLASGAAEMSTGSMSSAAPVQLLARSSAVRVTSNLVEGGVPAGLPGVGGLLGLCFAVLTALVAWVLARGRAPRVWALVRRTPEVVVARGPGHDRDPPSLLVLSVHRC
jgi:hypothetical protein